MKRILSLSTIILFISLYAVSAQQLRIQPDLFAIEELPKIKTIDEPDSDNEETSEDADKSVKSDSKKIFGIDCQWLLNQLPDHGLNHLFSIDLSYALAGWEHNGWGIGVNYEQRIWRYFSLKASASTLTSQLTETENRTSDYQFDLTAFCYPFGKGLEWLYVGCGIGSDYLIYSGPDSPTPPNDIIISTIPTIGWKQIIFKNFMVDMNIGYRFVIQNSNHMTNNESFIRTGFQIGFKFRILWNQLLRSAINSYVLHQDE